MTDKPYLVRADDVKAAAESFSHPWNPNSRVIGTHLSPMAGLQRTGLSLVRVPAGKESFAYHLHHREEEWIYILSGRGTAEIDEKEYEVGPGDFMGFPSATVAHHLRNTGVEDLVYLTGGENLEHEIADFPRLGRRMVRMGRHIDVFDLEDAKSMDPKTTAETE